MNRLDLFQMLDLTSQYNNDGISYASNLGDGRFNVWWNTFPAEELPDSNSIVTVGGVPFRFPPKEDGLMNNILTEGQILQVKPERYDWIYVLGAGERRAEDTVYLHFASGAVEAETIRISDFWPGPSFFGEPVAFRTQNMHYPKHIQYNHQPTIWLQRIPVTRIDDALVEIHLPENTSIHLFAITLVPSSVSVAKGEWEGSAV